MTGWRDAVLREFTPQVARLTLVADPDALLLDGGIIEGIRARGFDLIEFDDHVAFRFAYESKYRSAWDRGEVTDLVVVLRSSLADLASLPFDCIADGPRNLTPIGLAFDQVILNALSHRLDAHVFIVHPRQQNNRQVRRLGPRRPKRPCPLAVGQRKV